MTIKLRLLVLAVAIAVNAAALAAAQMALVQISVREHLARFEPARITVTGPRYGHSAMATCPAPGVL